jgi:mono/diheme cytochrome c family protein
MTAHRFNSTLRREPSRLQPESWGSGPVDYASMVQPVFDKHCVECHGGEKGIEGGLDLTGGWTEHFNNSYENLVSRREVIYKAPLIGGIDCMNGTAYYSAQILAPYQHGSGKAPLADVVITGHEDKVKLSKEEKELVLAWIDTNGLYYGTWNFTKHGYSLPVWNTVKTELVKVMQENNCVKCHADDKGNISRFEADWFNLEKPELSRILRAPLPKDSDGYGLGFCRNVPVDQNWRRVRMLNNSQYQHAVVPLSSFPVQEQRRWDKSGGEAVVSFESPNAPVYQRMLGLLTAAHNAALSAPRIDMPGGNSVAGQFRQIHPMPIPQKLPKLSTTVDVANATVLLTWDRSAETFGLNFHLYRNGERIAETTAHSYLDEPSSAGLTKYELVLESAGVRSKPIAAEVEVPPISSKSKKQPFEAFLPATAPLLTNLQN